MAAIPRTNLLEFADELLQTEEADPHELAKGSYDYIDPETQYELGLRAWADYIRRRSDALRRSHNHDTDTLGLIRAYVPSEVTLEKRWDHLLNMTLEDLELVADGYRRRIVANKVELKRIEKLIAAMKARGAHVVSDLGDEFIVKVWNEGNA